VLEVKKLRACETDIKLSREQPPILFENFYRIDL
jgi:hypothetical protein